MFKFVHMCRSQRDSQYPPEGTIDEITAVRDQTKLQYKRKQRLPSELHEQREATRSPPRRMKIRWKGPKEDNFNIRLSLLIHLSVYIY